MNSSSSTAAAAAPAAPAARAEPAPGPRPSPAAREVRLIVLLVAGAIAAGSALQLFIMPGPLELVAAAGIAGAVLLVLALARPGRLRVTLTSFRFVSVLLVALALAAILGTLILQGKPPQVYEARYNAGLPFGDLILALRLDDIFHSLWFAGLLALFGAAVISSAVQRWPVKVKSAGFFACHLGLITTLTGAALSTTLSVKGQVDLHAGGQVVSEAEAVVPGLFDTNGRSVTRQVPLGFDLRLDRFDLVRYETEYRVAYYELTPDGQGAKLKASFDPEVGKVHRLPGGAVFRMKSLMPDTEDVTAKEMKHPAAVLEVKDGDRIFETPVLAAEKVQPVPLPGEQRFLVFERRSDEVKAFRSTVTALGEGTQRTALLAVNAPFTFGGWTFYQSNYHPEDPTYSGLQAVRDPGVPFVFLGFGLISLGVIYMFYVETALKHRRRTA